MSSGRSGPLIHRGQYEAVTRSPTANRVTESPAATTSPAPSLSGTTPGRAGSG